MILSNEKVYYYVSFMFYLKLIIITRNVFTAKQSFNSDVTFTIIRKE